MTFWWRLLGFWLILGLAIRLLFRYFYPDYAVYPGFTDYIVGSVNDLLAFVLVTGGVALIAPNRRYWLYVAGFVCVAVTLLIVTAEIFFWFEFESRLDRLVFHYLAYPFEVAVFLEDQFFLSLFLLPFVLLCLAVLAVLSPPQPHAIWPKTQLGLIMGAVLVVVWGQPLGQSSSRVLSEFVSNGYLGVLAAARYPSKAIPWLQAPTDTSAQSFPPELSEQNAEDPTLTQLRSQLGQKKHIVLIIEESFAGPVWYDRTLRRQYLPHFNRLVQSAVTFDNMFATGSRTTRGMEALLNGFPPLPGISTTQRAGNERLPSLARGLKAGGFYPVFLYGGWPDFSDFYSYWQAMGFEQTWSREDFDPGFETSWGVSDQALFDRLLTEMDQLVQEHTQVFLATLTVSHHRPYDFPAGAIELPSDERSSTYAMSYADFALGEFLQTAQSQSWYEDTLFIVAADHGLLPRGDALIPATSYRIPLLFYGHGIKPREMQGMSSSVSLAKTLMKLFEIDSEESFTGADLLCDCDTPVPLEFGYHIGLLDRDMLHVIHARGHYLAWQFDPVANTLRYFPEAEASPESRKTYR